ncbi:MAG: transcriptional regulator [Acidimicrobiia bacterium]|nr:transcriptional regulator [Acidimicrobiia bacterium]
MQDVKRFELVIGSANAGRFLDALDTMGLPHRTVIPGIYGQGQQGARGGDPFSTFDNTYVLVAVPPERSEEVVEALRPLLHTFGGMCLVSDAKWVLR